MFNDYLVEVPLSNYLNSCGDAFLFNLLNCILNSKSQNFVDPRFSITLVLVKSRGLKIQTWVKHNRTSITQTQALIFQTYPNPRV